MFLATLFVSASAFAQTTRVKVEDTIVNFEAKPIEVNTCTMVPARNLIAAMGGTMRWDAGKETLSVWKGNHRIDFILGNRQAMVDGKVMSMDEAPFIDRGRIFIPLKFAATGTGYTISKESGWLVLRSVLK